MRSWTLTRLARGLRDRAEEVDTLVQAPLLSATRESYRRFLCDLYGFVLAFEARFAFTTCFDVAFIDPRIRSGRIASDLLALGLTTSELRRLALRCRVPELVDPAEALGWTFVVERVMSRRDQYRRMASGLEAELSFAGSFLRSDDGENEQRWYELGRAIDGCILDESDVQRLTAGARAAFACLEAWLRVETSSTVLVESQMIA